MVIFFGFVIIMEFIHNRYYTLFVILLYILWNPEAEMSLDISRLIYAIYIYIIHNLVLVFQISGRLLRLSYLTRVFYTNVKKKKWQIYYILFYKVLDLRYKHARISKKSKTI